MNVSQEEAQASLSKVRDVTIQIQRATTSAYASPLLILWGLLWIIAFTAAHFYLAYAYHIFITMSAAGCVGTAVVLWLLHSKAPVRDTSSPSIVWRIVLFWVSLSVYAVIWLLLFSPFSGRQCNVFLSTVAMFAYVVMGLWLTSCFMVVLGLTVTAATLVGYYCIETYYCLWMAIVGGGAFLGAGLYMRLRWR